MLYSIPTASLLLLNLIVIVFVARERAQSRAFLFVNAAAMILWSASIHIWRAAPTYIVPLWINMLACMAIGANQVYFAATRPSVIFPAFRRGWRTVSAVFLPALAASCFADYATASLVREPSPFIYSSWAKMWACEGSLPLLVQLGYLACAAVCLSIRIRETASGPDRNLARHLLAAIIAPTVFFVVFAMVSTYYPSISLIPSPALLMALIAQLGILVVIRQEEVERPLYLSRWIFYSITVLAGFFASQLLFTFYESATSTVLLAPTVRLTILATILVLVAVGSIPSVQSFFDRLMFRRAWEYRQLVRAAQAELFETRQRLRRAERLSVVGEMAARIAHEIKNPLGPIKGYTQMMREQIAEMPDFPKRERFLRHLAIVSEEVDNIDRKVRHLLDLARKPGLTVEAEDLNRMAQRAATLLRLEAESLAGEEGRSRHAIAIQEDLDPALPELACNRARVEEALYNVCRNAFEAIGKRGRIVIRTRRLQSADQRDGIALIVEDDGPGFSDVALSRLFEPFYTEKSAGSGLGLSIVKSHIDLHGGTVNFARRDGGGTVAVLWLPMDPEIVPAEASHPGQSLPKESAVRVPKPEPEPMVESLKAEGE